MTIETGVACEHGFVIDDAAMQAFAALSGDHSAIHTDPAYARSRGYEDVIVYGGLMLAQLSHVVGNLLPGDKGVSMHWSIDYRQPLYVGEQAVLAIEVVHVSDATGLITSKFIVRTGDRVVATGRSQSLLPPE